MLGVVCFCHHPMDESEGHNIWLFLQQTGKSRLTTKRQKLPQQSIHAVYAVLVRADSETFDRCAFKRQPMLQQSDLENEEINPKLMKESSAPLTQ